METAAGHRLRAETVALAQYDAKQRHVEIGADDKHARYMRTCAVFSTSGPTMNPGVSHSDRIGISKASQSCMKRAALSAAIGIDRAAEMHRIIGDHAERLAFDANQRGDHADAEVARSSSTESTSASDLSAVRIS